MRRPDFGFEFMLRERSFDPRYEISAIGIVVRVLELAAAAFREVAAGWLLVVLAERQRSVVEHGIAGNTKRHMSAICRHAVASRSNAHDQLTHPRSAIA
jgi:hypothetical protein